MHGWESYLLSTFAAPSPWASRKSVTEGGQNCRACMPETHSFSTRRFNAWGCSGLRHATRERSIAVVVTR